MKNKPSKKGSLLLLVLMKLGAGLLLDCRRPRPEVGLLSGWQAHEALRRHHHLESVPGSFPITSGGAAAPKGILTTCIMVVRISSGCPGGRVGCFACRDSPGIVADRDGDGEGSRHDEEGEAKDQGGPFHDVLRGGLS